jgi:Raf kinase inhibitor-like YbhB/YbcL family protein
MLAFALSPVACMHATVTQERADMKLELTSSAFNEGQPIPMKYTCDGEDISPPLTWRGIPETANSIALICDDPDAPSGTWVHWVLYDLPANLTALNEAVTSAGSIAEGGAQGTNDFKRIGYGGPCPPSGKPHRYFFKLYALDANLGLKQGATKDELVSAMKGHILTQGQLMGTYQRK